MSISRRRWLYGTACAALCGTSAWTWHAGSARQRHRGSRTPRTHSITPVVFDGKWNWREQPPDQQGYLDPREFDIRAGIRWRTDAPSRNIRCSTLIPVAFPEQELGEWRIEKTEGCEALIAPLGKSASQLQVFAPHSDRGQSFTIEVSGRVRLFRHCPKHDPSGFPAEQSVPPEIAAEALGNSPGIRCETNALRELASSVASRHETPWTRVRKYFDWVWENIEGLPGAYTSVQEAIRDRRGDCEERAGVFVALCRAAGIPARLVLVPNHCWAEFWLHDATSKGHWIPAHTAAYNWFGWTGTHELVLQKGDRIYQPGSDSTVRLITDWWSFEGRKPELDYFAELIPVDGPGKRAKNATGGWDLVASHPEDRFLRE